jgi:succinyl-CoA synthetase beta subunit
MSSPKADRRREERWLAVPLVVRLEGTNVSEDRHIRNSGLNDRCG